MTDAAFLNDLLTALPEALQRLGQTWGRTVATVVNGADSSNMFVIFDGDPNETIVGGVYSMIGALPADARVYVDSVPPAGQYISGLLALPTPGNLLANVVASATAEVTIAAGTGTDNPIPGLSVTVDNVPVGARWTVTTVLDIRETVLGTALMVGYLYVDGVRWTDPATATDRAVIASMSAVGQRGTFAQQFGDDEFLTPGSHTFEQNIQRNTGTGTQVTGATHSTMRVQVYS